MKLFQALFLVLSLSALMTSPSFADEQKPADNCNNTATAAEEAAAKEEAVTPEASLKNALRAVEAERAMISIQGRALTKNEKRRLVLLEEAHKNVLQAQAILNEKGESPNEL